MSKLTKTILIATVCASFTPAAFAASPGHSFSKFWQNLFVHHIHRG
jgi:hypothetical protein